MEKFYVSVIYKVGMLYLQLSIARDLFLDKKRELNSIKINFDVINGGLSKKNLQKLAIADLFLQEDTLFIPIPLDNLYNFKDTYIKLKTLIFNYNDCSINLTLIQHPYSFQELLEKQTKLNFQNIQRRATLKRTSENLIKLLR